jgi:hypothetical protein
MIEALRFFFSFYGPDRLVLRLAYPRKGLTRIASWSCKDEAAAGPEMVSEQESAPDPSVKRARHSEVGEDVSGALTFDFPRGFSADPHSGTLRLTGCRARSRCG